jgi:hypothetical protein
MKLGDIRHLLLSTPTKLVRDRCNKHGCPILIKTNYS